MVITRNGSSVIGIIDAFQGRRHQILKALWNSFATYRGLDLVWVPNPALVRPDVFLNEVWRRLRRSSAQYIVLTESDFLPSFDQFPLLATAAAAEHAQRDPDRNVTFTGFPAQWYMVFDKLVVNGALDFRSPNSPYHDPGNDLAPQLKQMYGVDIMLLPQRDCWPVSYGLECVAGTHLFWSRHLHDDPDMIVCGFKVGEIQRIHDQAVAAWMRSMPEELQLLFKADGVYNEAMRMAGMAGC